MHSFLEWKKTFFRQTSCCKIGPRSSFLIFRTAIKSINQSRWWLCGMSFAQQHQQQRQTSSVSVFFDKWAVNYGHNNRTYGCSVGLVSYLLLRLIKRGASICNCTNIYVQNRLWCRFNSSMRRLNSLSRLCRSGTTWASCQNFLKLFFLVFLLQMCVVAGAKLSNSHCYIINPVRKGLLIKEKKWLLLTTPSLLPFPFSHFFSKNTRRQNVLMPRDMFRLSCPSHSWFVNINLLPQNPPWNLMQNGPDSHGFIQLSHLRAIHGGV